jgi:hypothetical protein
MTIHSPFIISSRLLPAVSIGKGEEQITVSLSPSGFILDGPFGEHRVTDLTLREQIPFIESDIRSDFAPGVLASASIQECAHRCAEMRADAMRERYGILSDARKEADQIRAQAVRFNELQREELKRTLNAILSRID